MNILFSVRSYFQIFIFHDICTLRPMKDYDKKKKSRDIRNQVLTESDNESCPYQYMDKVYIICSHIRGRNRALGLLAWDSTGRNF